MNSHRSTFPKNNFGVNNTLQDAVIASGGGGDTENLNSTTANIIDLTATTGNIIDLNATNITTSNLRVQNTSEQAVFFTNNTLNTAGNPIAETLVGLGCFGQAPDILTISGVINTQIYGPNRVGIKTDTPNTDFEVNGDIQAQNLTILDSISASGGISSNNALFTNSTCDNLVATNATISNVTLTNANITNATITNFSLPSNATTTNLVTTNATATNLLSTTSLTTTGVADTAFITNATVSNLTCSNSILTNTTVSNTLSSNSSIGNAWANSLIARTSAINTAGSTFVLINAGLWRTGGSVVASANPSFGGVNDGAIRGGLEIGSTSQDNQVWLTTTNTVGSNDVVNATNTIFFQHHNHPTGWRKCQISTRGLGGHGRCDFSINLIEATGGGNATFNDSKFFIHGTSGNVGIRTTTPSASLHVGGTGGCLITATCSMGTLRSDAGTAGTLWISNSTIANLHVNSITVGNTIQSNVTSGTPLAPSVAMEIQTDSIIKFAPTTGSMSNEVRCISGQNLTGSGSMFIRGAGTTRGNRALSLLDNLNIVSESTSPNYLSLSHTGYTGGSLNLNCSFGSLVINNTGPSFRDFVVNANVRLPSVQSNLYIGNGGPQPANITSGSPSSTSAFANPIMTVENGSIYSQSIYPLSDNTYNLGSSNRKFDFIWSNNVLQVSSRDEKEDISELDLGLDFIKSLKPKKYKYKHSGDTTRYGFIIDELPTEGGLVIQDKGVSYTDFIAPLVKAIQELDERIANGKRRVNSARGGHKTPHNKKITN